jgi:hypothetical protein
MEKVLLKYINEKVKKGIKIIISSTLNNSTEKIWNKLLNIETLIEICKPMATFKLKINEKEMKWEINKEYIFKLFIYGFIPFGDHKIILKKLDKENKIILSNEYNKIVKKWNHLIIMENLGENEIKYTDEVEIYAGIFTIFTAIWAKLFYKNRQKKWKRISMLL